MITANQLSRGARGGHEAVPPDRRGEVVSSFFVVAYIAISGPVVLVGVIAEQTNIRDAGLTLAAVVAMLAATVMVLLLRQRG